MYATLWSRNRLRQGDILSKLPFPHWTKTIPWQVQGTIAGAPDQPFLVPASVPAQLRNVMVISHDCEFDDGKQRSHFLVARIDPINKKTTTEQLTILRASNNVRQRSEEAEPAFLDSFYLEPIKDVLDDYCRVNFTALAGIPMDSSVDALKVKVGELDHETRVQLREKLGVFFGRPAADIPDDQKYDPTVKEEPPATS